MCYLNKSWTFFWFDKWNILCVIYFNGSYTAAFKNLLDWMSRHEGKVFANKKIFLLSTSDGGRGGLGVMEAALSRLPRHGAEILAHYSFPTFQDNFTVEEGITNPDLKRLFLLEVDKVKGILGQAKE